METPIEERLYRTIVENTPDAVIYADKEGIIRLWNSGSETLFGYSAGEALGRSLDIIVPENLRGRHWEGYRRAMVTGETKYGKELLAVPGIRKDGTRISLEFSVLMVRDPGGNLLGTAVILRDVTARWKREKELMDRIAALKAPLEKSA